MGVTPAELAVIAVSMALVLAVCLIACLVPTRRALRVEPAAALRSEA